MTSIDTVVDSIIGSIESFKSFCIVIFWLQEEADREGVCRELSTRLAGRRIIPHVLRSTTFQDPNAWASDAVSLLDSLRDEVADLDVADHESPLGLILISRSKLNVAQASSPAVAPEWMPGFGGREVTVFARDARLISTCSLEAEEASIALVKAMLFQLEIAFLRVVRSQFVIDRHHGQTLWDQVLRNRSRLDKRSQFLEYWANGLDSVTDASSYRPSLTFGWSLISAMWETFLTASPSQLLSRSKAFCDYLLIKSDWLPTPPDPTPVLPILFRGPEDYMRDADEVATRGVILTVGLSCQLITAAAHADQYGRVSASVLGALSQDLRRTLAAAERQALWGAAG